MALPLTRVALLAAGAGAAWYARQKLSGDSQEASPGTPEPAPGAAPARPAPEAQVTEPRPADVAPVPPDLDDEAPPAAFEDAHQQGWYGEEVGKDPAAEDELEMDPATADEAELALAAEDAEEIEEPIAPPDTAAPGRGEPGHVTRVVDDLLEGRRPAADEEPIEDATVVEDDRDQPAP